MQLQQLVACPDCGSFSIDREAFHAPPWWLSRCRSCGLVFLNPRPEDAFYNGGTDSAEFYLPQADKATVAREVAANANRVAHLEIHVRPGSVLDVGCGTGYFVKAALDRGWDAHGCDPSRGCVEFGTRLSGRGRLRVGFLEDDDARYDAVTAFHVLEHLLDAPGFLAAAHKHLRAGGVLLLETPNLFSFDFLRERERWHGLQLPHHVRFYSSEGLSALLARTGFEVVESRTSVSAFYYEHLDSLLRRLAHEDAIIHRIAQGLSGTVMVLVARRQ